ncbi:MAG TPA: DUF1330 domain-containing protein [Thermoleophilaceae bacterium]|nr:DUF1330 domain-containing protein [Thermoleophilaceae bacterium]
MAVNPTREQIEAMAAIAGREGDGPLVMLNLNRYRERAAYTDAPPGGGSADVSGREAYERYGAVALDVLRRVGGDVLWQAFATLTVIGDDGERWDEVIAVRYPSAQAFLDLALDPEIGAALAHRDAGLEHATLIRCTA